MSLIGNILWIILGGLLVSFQYIVAGIGLICTIIGIPFGIQSIKIGVYALLPFGKTTVAMPESQSTLYFVMNIIWLCTLGIPIVLTHLGCALLCAITVIGIPFAAQHLKLARLSLTPFGQEIRDVA